MDDLLAENFALLSLETRMGVPGAMVLPTMDRRLSGLLLIELAIHEEIAEHDDTLVVMGTRFGDPLLDRHLVALQETTGPASAQVEQILHNEPNMWNTIVTRLVDDKVLMFRRGNRSRRATGLEILDTARRDRLVALVREAARSNDVLDARTAALLASSGMWPVPFELRKRFETSGSIVCTVNGHSVIHPLGPAFVRARAAEREASLCPAAQSILRSLASEVARGSSVG